MKRVFIIHGWEADPGSNWFPWLKEELTKKGITAVTPAMPDSAHPDCGRWIGYLKKIVGQVDEDTFFVGHSLGPIAILRFLESLPLDEKAGGVIMVAGFSESLGIPEIESFFAQPLDYAKVKKMSQRFVVINSNDDPYVPMDRAKILERELGAELIVVHQAGHLNAGTGFFKLPAVLEKILQWSK
jgi:uncharacterized protein